MIKYIQFRHDIVIPAGGANGRSFAAWTHDKHVDIVEPERTQFGVTLHAVETATTYVKGVAVKEQKRTGRRWEIPISAVAWIQIDEDKQKAKA